MQQTTDDAPVGSAAHWGPFDHGAREILASRGDHPARHLPGRHRHRPDVKDSRLTNLKTVDGLGRLFLTSQAPASVRHHPQMPDAARHRPTTNIAYVYQAVRMTARASALLFAGAQATAALGPPTARASRPLYLAFMGAHAAHFAVVTRYAKVNGGRDLFPGGRSMNEVGGWPTVLSIYFLFSVFALTGWAAGAPPGTVQPALRKTGHAATGLIGAMFVGTYLRQLTRSRWYVLLATTEAGAVAANILAQQRNHRSQPTFASGLIQTCAGSAEQAHLLDRRGNFDPTGEILRRS